MNISIPLLLANKDTIKPERIIVYIWLKWFCEQGGGCWDVDYKKLQMLSGIPVKNLSRSIASLYNMRLIDKEKRDGKIRVFVMDVPFNLEDNFSRKLAEVILFEKRKELSKQILVRSDKILVS